MLNTSYSTKDMPLHEVLDPVTDNGSCIVFKVIRKNDSDIEKILSTGILDGNEAYIRIRKLWGGCHQMCHRRLPVFCYQAKMIQ